MSLASSIRRFQDHPVYSEACRDQKQAIRVFRTDQKHSDLQWNYNPNLNLNRFMGSVKGVVHNLKETEIGKRAKLDSMNTKTVFSVNVEFCYIFC